MTVKNQSNMSIVYRFKNLGLRNKKADLEGAHAIRWVKLRGIIFKREGLFFNKEPVKLVLLHSDNGIVTPLDDDLINKNTHIVLRREMLYPAKAITWSGYRKLENTGIVKPRQKNYDDEALFKRKYPLPCLLVCKYCDGQLNRPFTSKCCYTTRCEVCFEKKKCCNIFVEGMLVAAPDRITNGLRDRTVKKKLWIDSIKRQRFLDSLSTVDIVR